VKVFLLGVFLFLAWQSAHPDPVELDASQALTFAKQSGRLPPWFGLTDSVRLVYRPGYVYACITDQQTGDRWTAGGPLPSFRLALLTGRWTFSEPRPYTELDRAVCWP